MKQGLEIKEEEEVKEKKSEDEDSIREPANRGKLILDASCAPADISYPTDLGLLNQARKQTETIIDILYNSLPEKIITLTLWMLIYLLTISSNWLWCRIGQP